jgi:hypothetical protein
MKSILFLSLMLSYLLQVSAQGSQSSVTSQSSVASQNSVTAAPSPTTTAFTLTPQESASSLASYYSALATSAPIQPGSGPLPGDAGSSAGSSQSASEAGASGSDSGSFTLSKAGIIAIAVVVSCVVIFGSKSHPTSGRRRASSNLGTSCNICTLVYGQEARLGSPPEDSKLGKENSSNAHTKEKYISKRC